MRKAVCLTASLVVLTACSTEVKRLELQRDQLTRIEASVGTIAEAAEAQAFDPKAHDIHLKISPAIFDQVLTAFDNTIVPIDAPGRPVTFTLTSARMNFQTGYPTVALVASALDEKSGAKADIELDANLIIEGDRAKPNELFVRVVATKIVPNLRWGIFNLSKWRFAHSLARLEAAKVTERLPRVQLPLRNDFAFGGPAASKQFNLPVKDGVAGGVVSTPSTEIKGALSVQQVLFLKNGVHVFADVGGM